MYRVSLVINGDKPEEYEFNICLTGYFLFNQSENLTEEQKQTLISKNTLSILMPYLRSEVTLLTSQPEVDSVVLQPININSFLGN